MLLLRALLEERTPPSAQLRQLPQDAAQALAQLLVLILAVVFRLGQEGARG